MGQADVLIEDFNLVCGTANIVQLDRERGVLLGGADPRGVGIALAYKPQRVFVGDQHMRALPVTDPPRTLVTRRR